MKLIYTLMLTLLFINGCQTNSHSHSVDKPLIITGDIEYGELTGRYPFFQHHSASSETPSAMNQLKAIEQPTELLIFFGVWCHDSIREVPRLMQLLSEVNNPVLNYRLIALDMNKQEPQGRASSHQIRYTPTIVVKRDGTELGRIVEKPEQGLAEDLASILSQNP